MTDSTLCGVCRAPVPDTGRICTTCTTDLRDRLRHAPDLLTELDTTHARQGRAGATGIRTDTSPLPDMHAGDLATHLRHLLTRIADDLGAPPQRNGTTAAHWLTHQTGSLRMRDWAPDASTQIKNATANGWRAVDRPPDRWYAGPCNAEIDQGTDGIVLCDSTLWVDLDQADVRCRGCRTVWDVLARRSWLLAAAEDIHETARTIASLVTLMTRERLPVGTIHSWVSRGRLAVADVDPATGAKLYRVGDVIALRATPEPATEPMEQVPA